MSFSKTQQQGRTSCFKRREDLVIDTDLDADGNAV